MLKSAIYYNVFILLIMSIFLLYLIKFLNINSNLRKIKKVIIIYIIFNFISIRLYSGRIVDIDWDFMFLLPISIISFIIQLASIYIINKKLNDTVFTDFSDEKNI